MTREESHCFEVGTSASRAILPHFRGHPNRLMAPLGK